MLNHSSDEQIRSILVIRLSSMGDVLLSTPLVRLLRQRFPDARIDVCVGEEWSAIYRYNPHCNTVLGYKRSFSRRELQDWKHTIAAALQSSTGSPKYDLILDLQRNRRSRQIWQGLGSTIHRIRKYRLHKLALVYLKRNLHAQTIHITERYRNTASHLGLNDDGRGLEMLLGKEVIVAERREGGIVRIGIAPGAHHATKRWLPKRFAEAALLLAERLQTHRQSVEIVLLGGRADENICREVADFLVGKMRYVLPPDNATLAETSQLLDSCAALLCNDTGIMHLAAARGVPLVAVFGSTVTELGFAPFRVAHRIVEAQVECRPCTHIGRSACPKGHFACMRNIEAVKVAEAAWELLSESSHFASTSRNR